MEPCFSRWQRSYPGYFSFIPGYWKKVKTCRPSVFGSKHQLHIPVTDLTCVFTLSQKVKGHIEESVHFLLISHHTLQRTSDNIPNEVSAWVSLPLTPFMCAYEYLYLSYSAPPPPISLNLCSRCRGSGSAMRLQRRKSRAHCISRPLSRQERRISFLGDAINLDFISESAVKEPGAGDQRLLKLIPLPLSQRLLSSQRFSDREGDAAIKDVSPSRPVRMPLCAGGHFKCKHGLSGSVYLIMTHWLAAHVSLSRLK